MTKIGRSESDKIKRIATGKLNKPFEIINRKCKFVLTRSRVYDMEKVMKHNHQHTQTFNDVRIVFGKWAMEDERVSLH